MLLAGCGDAGAAAAPPQPAPVPWSRASEHARCGATVASRDVLAALAPRWASCGEGCEMSTAVGSFVVGGHEPVRTVGGVPQLVATTLAPDHRQWTTSVAPLTAAPTFALSHRLDAADGCTARVAIGDGGLAVSLHTDGTLEDELIVGLDRDAPTVLAMHDVVVGLAVGSDGAWVDLDRAGLRRADGAVTAAGWVHPRAIDDTVLLRNVDGRRLGRITDGVLTPWPRSERTISEVTLDRARGRVLWIEADDVDTGFDRPVLWSANRNGDDRSEHGPVPGSDGRGGWGMVADDARVLGLDGPEHAWVRTLDTEAASDLRPPDALVWVRPLWVDEQDAWLLAGPADGPADTIVRKGWH